MRRFITEIETEGGTYRMKPDKTKFELLTHNPTARTILPENAPVKKQNVATYLGCEVGLEQIPDKKWTKFLQPLWPQ